MVAPARLVVPEVAGDQDFGRNLRPQDGKSKIVPGMAATFCHFDVAFHLGFCFTAPRPSTQDR
jgi:hypothetical protein